MEIKNNLSQISNIFRGFNEDNSKKIKFNQLYFIEKNNNKENKIIVKFSYKKNNNDDKEKMIKITLNEFLKESYNNYFLKYNYITNQNEDIIDFSFNNFYSQNDLNNMNNSHKLKYKNNIQPINHFDFYCKLHGRKYIYYCYDCKIHLCSECLLLSYNHVKTLFNCFKNIIGLAIEAKIKISNNDNNLFKEILVKSNNINNEVYNNKKKHMHVNLINLDEYKLTNNELKEYENKINIISEKLENSKNQGNYFNNILLLNILSST